MISSLATPAMIPPALEDISDDEEPKPRPHVSKFDAPQTVTIGGQVEIQRKKVVPGAGKNGGFCHGKL